MSETVYGFTPDDSRAIKPLSAVLAALRSPTTRHGETQNAKAVMASEVFTGMRDRERAYRWRRIPLPPRADPYGQGSEAAAALREAKVARIRCENAGRLETLVWAVHIVRGLVGPGEAVPREAADAEAFVRHSWDVGPFPDEDSAASRRGWVADELGART